MIVVKIIGGLGNQLFQYALGRHLAFKNNTELILDLRAFEEYYSLHHYALDHFNINAKPASEKEIKKFAALSNPLSRLKRKISNIGSPWRFIQEEAENFNPEILALTGNLYLEGYWQSESYFKEIRSHILQELSVKSSLSKKTSAIHDQIEGQNCASIHIRRGDYVSNKTTHAIHGICDLGYYDKAMSELEKQVEIDSYFVFSDDIPWVKENLKSQKCLIFVDHNDALTNFEDLYLMSKCHHNIIANSSFSWWGAWLNKNENKVVIAPKIWFADTSRNSSSIVPSNWIKC